MPMMPKQPDVRQESLAFQLRGAAQALLLVSGGMALPQALARIFDASQASPPSRGAIQDIAYRAMRNLGRSRELIKLLVQKPPSPMLDALLHCALTLLDENMAAGYGDFTVVDQAVSAAAADAATAPAKGMINAVLRRYLRERAALRAQAMQTPAGRWNYPLWWIDSLKRAYPDQWQAILDAGNQPPPLTLRVNQRKSTLEAYLQLLKEAGIAARQVGPSGVRLDKPLPVTRIPGFADGMVSVQDAAAQRSAPLLDVRDGMRVLDACAAPGGKTGHLLEIADINLVALDHNPDRLQRVKENLHRLDLVATMKTGDAADARMTNAGGWWDGKPFARILADLPCTASGIVRRHPDIRWLRRPNDAVNLATVSAGILDNLWQLLEPGGKLLMVTCSLWPEESEQQAAAFAARHDSIRLPAPGQLLPDGVNDDQDGLFHALFQKGSDT